MDKSPLSTFRISSAQLQEEISILLPKQQSYLKDLQNRELFRSGFDFTNEYKGTCSPLTEQDEQKIEEMRQGAIQEVKEEIQRLQRLQNLLKKTQKYTSQSFKV